MNWRLSILPYVNIVQFKLITFCTKDKVNVIWMMSLSISTSVWTSESDLQDERSICHFRFWFGNEWTYACNGGKNYEFDEGANNLSYLPVSLDRLVVAGHASVYDIFDIEKLIMKKGICGVLWCLVGKIEVSLRLNGGRGVYGLEVDISLIVYSWN